MYVHESRLLVLAGIVQIFLLPSRYFFSFFLALRFKDVLDFLRYSSLKKGFICFTFRSKKKGRKQKRKYKSENKKKGGGRYPKKRTQRRNTKLMLSHYRWNFDGVCLFTPSSSFFYFEKEKSIFIDLKSTASSKALVVSFSSLAPRFHAAAIQIR